jgi:hypothetical protein
MDRTESALATSHHNLVIEIVVDEGISFLFGSGLRMREQ